MMNAKGINPYHTEISRTGARDQTTNSYYTDKDTAINFQFTEVPIVLDNCKMKSIPNQDFQVIPTTLVLLENPDLHLP